MNRIQTVVSLSPFASFSLNYNQLIEVSSMLEGMSLVKCLKAKQANNKKRSIANEN